MGMGMGMGMGMWGRWGGDDRCDGEDGRCDGGDGRSAISNPTVVLCQKTNGVCVGGVAWRSGEGRALCRRRSPSMSLPRPSGSR